MNEQLNELLEEKGLFINDDKASIISSNNTIDIMEIDNEGYNLYGNTYYNVHEAFDALLGMDALDNEGGNKMWEFKEYIIFKETDLLRFENHKGDILGYVSFDDGGEGMVKELDDGTDPIADKWEDGMGNTLNIDGWGAQ